jgi:hypothetical protein
MPEKVTGVAAPVSVEQPCQDCGGTGLVDTSGFGDMATCEECRGRGTSGVAEGLLPPDREAQAAVERVAAEVQKSSSNPGCDTCTHRVVDYPEAFKGCTWVMWTRHTCSMREMELDNNKLDTSPPWCPLKNFSREL